MVPDVEGKMTIGKGQERHFDWGVLPLSEGFRAYETSRNRTDDWRFMSLLDVVRKQFKQNGFHIFTLRNTARYVRLRLRRQIDPLDAMRISFVWELSVGLADAIGYFLPRSADDNPVLIPKESWKHGTFDWDKAELTGSGFIFADVRVLMPHSSWLVKDHSYDVETLPALKTFPPSDEHRKALGIPATSGANSSQSEPERLGRPSYRAQIEQAYFELSVRDGLPEKELIYEIRERVKEHTGQTTDKGLGDSAIRKHIIRIRRETPSRKK
ncbi:hypothetical protein [Thioclava electrotropha]|uniref:Uncharacterized protein n=1 Tax=Thioclava electrotropha TaxID=1549850 RepID=A0ABX6YPD9_9RHOB|nr:hypothetical protein [Thioclava electrotropha]QPZ89691.1 hypothetical protein AKL02_001520 [Thioclava electrotropha]